MKNISIVIPCYNEERALPQFLIQLIEFEAREVLYHLEIIFVDDGSTDGTNQILVNYCDKHRNAHVLSFTRNFGKEAALTAGLDFASGDAIVFMDSDLQHPFDVVKKFLNSWLEGNHVVAARRRSRNTDSALYKIFATSFYKIHNIISDIDIPQNVGDFRLIDREVADKIKSLPEKNRFMKGLFAWVGYDIAIIDYDVEPRFAGKSKFNTWKSWNLAVEGITSFSTLPLRVWTYIGILVFLIGLIYSLAIFIQTILMGITTPGYLTLITCIVLFGGVQLIGLGIFGEYLGRIYTEVKRRPMYLIKGRVSKERCESE